MGGQQWAGATRGLALRCAPACDLTPTSQSRKLWRLAGWAPTGAGLAPAPTLAPLAHGCSDHDAYPPPVRGSPGATPGQSGHLKGLLRWGHPITCESLLLRSSGNHPPGRNMLIDLGAPQEQSPWGAASCGAPETSRGTGTCLRDAEVAGDRGGGGLLTLPGHPASGASP